MPWRIRRHTHFDKRPIIIAVVVGLIISGGIVALWFANTLPPCSLEAEVLLRQLKLCR